MFSSDDDEPLAVIASKAKQQGQRVKKRRQKAEKRKRFKSDSSTESDTNDDVESGKKNQRKKKKPAIEDEFDSDDIPLGDMNDKGGDAKTCEDTQIGKDPHSNKEHSDGEEKAFVDNDVERATTKCDDSSATVTDREQNHEKTLVNSDEEHAKDEEESNNSSSDDSEKKKTSKEDKRGSDNSNEERAQEDDDSDSSLSDDSEKNRPLEKQTKGRKEKRKRTTKRKDESESSDKKAIRKQKEKPQDGDALRLTRLKKMVTLAGLRIVYKKFFEDIADNDRLRVKALEKEMERRGLTPPFTMEACRAFKLQKEQEAELAELSKNHIIEIGENQKGRVTRGQRSAALATRRRGGIIFEESSDEDEEELEEREHMKQETQNMFKNLRGIVSDDADSD